MKLCRCRNCSKQYPDTKSRACLTGYCSMKCQHEKAKELGFKKQGKPGSPIHKTEYQILKDANSLGSVFIKE